MAKGESSRLPTRISPKKAPLKPMGTAMYQGTGRHNLPVLLFFALCLMVARRTHQNSGQTAEDTQKTTVNQGRGPQGNPKTPRKRRTDLLSQLRSGLLWQLLWSVGRTESTSHWNKRKMCLPRSMLHHSNFALRTVPKALSIAGQRREL